MTKKSIQPTGQPDGYLHDHQLNMRLTGEDMQKIMDINREFFDNEITNSTLARILLKLGIKAFRKDEE